MTDPTPKPWWPPHAARRHVQEPTPDARPAAPPTWPKDAVAEVERLRQEIDECWVPLYHGALAERDEQRTRAERAESNARDNQAVIEAQRATLDRVRVRLGRLLELIEEECSEDADEPVCHDHDRTDDGECALAADLRAVLDALQPCPTCSGPIRETVGMVCQTCGTDYAAARGGWGR